MQNIRQIDLGGVNAYLMENGGKFLLVDTGGHMFMDRQYENRLQKLMEELEKAGVTKENLVLILLTHGDNDHVCNAKELSEHFETPIAMNEKDVFMVCSQNAEVYKVNAKYQSIIMKFIFKLMNQKIEKLMQKVYGDFRPFEPDILLKEGDSLKEYGFDGVIYETPGHTDGSVSVLDSAGNLMAGDLFANNKKPSLAINAKDFVQMKASADRILKMGVKKVWPGHGMPYNQV